MTQPFCKNKAMARGGERWNNTLLAWKKRRANGSWGEESKGSQGRGEIELWGLTRMKHLPWGQAELDFPFAQCLVDL